MRPNQRVSLYAEALTWAGFAQKMIEYVGGETTPALRELKIQAAKLGRMTHKAFYAGLNLLDEGAENVSGIAAYKKARREVGELDKRIGVQHRKVLQLADTVIKQHASDGATRSARRKVIAQMRDFVGTQLEERKKAMKALKS
jgi:hypothetical protein